MKRSQRRLIEHIGIHAVLLILAALVLLPTVFLFLGSFKELNQLFSYPPTLFPRPFILRNYSDAWQAAPFGIFLFNSVIVGSLTTFAAVIVATLAAFAFSHVKPWGSKVLFLLFISGMMIPPQVTIIPRYFIMHKLGWIDSYQALVIPFLAAPIGIFLLYQFFRTVPKVLEDAAKLDGCGPFRFLLYVMIPLSRPTLGALAIITFVHSWNRYMWPLIATTTSAMRTAPIGIRMFLNQTEGSFLGMMMAGAVIVILPAIVAFVAGQKQFVRALARGGVKG
jgi:sn-glycerol 3-phosphate transport system permease protein